ncbi:MAG: HypC/HybG/HupF family hydrogenase formation chaperone [Methyloprofundus sp.]|nr:HypC/HybG/HupF family hydrogenase formation chaperone [Methyloprofundus sp.]
MCLAVPGKIISMTDGDALSRTGRVEFAGISKDVSLAYVPEARLNDYVIVHAGFAISILDQQEAQKSLQAFEQLHAIED